MQLEIKTGRIAEVIIASTLRDLALSDELPYTVNRMVLKSAAAEAAEKAAEATKGKEESHYWAAIAREWPRLEAHQP